MADTITFRPAAGILAALDERRGSESRTAHINAALTDYLFGSGISLPAEEELLGARPPGRANETEPGTSAVVASTECEHPRKDRRNLGYVVRCGVCGKVLR